MDSLKLLSAADGDADAGEDAEPEVDEVAKDDLLIMTAAVEVVEVAAVADAVACALPPASGEDLGWPLSSPTARDRHSGQRRRRRK